MNTGDIALILVCVLYLILWQGSKVTEIDFRDIWERVIFIQREINRIDNETKVKL